VYTYEDLQDIELLLKKRWKITLVPAVLILAAAIAVFIYGQLNRSDQLWKLTVALTILGGGYFLFFFGLYIRPARSYRTHVLYMLEGRKRITTGVFKSFSEDVSNRDGVECHAMMLNVGSTDDPEDDRLFYYDVHKPRPECALGTMVTVHSNDKMIASFEIA